MAKDKTVTTVKKKKTTKTVKKVFRKLDLSSFETANATWFDLVRNDPILSWALSIDQLNQDLENLHKEISVVPLARKVPTLAKIPLIGWLFTEDTETKVEWYEWKLSWIFISFDENYRALCTSEDLYNNSIQSLNWKIEKLEVHLEAAPLETDKQKLYANAVKNLIVAMSWTKARMQIMLDSAEEIKDQMLLNKPIFKELTDALIMETTWELGVKIANDSLNAMKKFMRDASTKMTDNAIAFGKEVNANKYDVLTSDTFRSNLERLHKWMLEIADIKKKAVAEFDAKNNLKFDVKNPLALSN